MNSVDQHLSASSKAATLLAMRSAKNDVFLVVEGDRDVQLFSNIFGLPTSNFVSCGGKEVLMELIGFDSAKGLDDGTIFVRDRDHDEVQTAQIKNKQLVVTGYYDIELDLLEQRLFRRIFNEFASAGDDDDRYSDAWSSLVTIGAIIGALRKTACENSFPIDFSEYQTRKFVKLSPLSIDIKTMVAYFVARSKLDLNRDDLADQIEEVLGESPEIQLCSGKDLLRLIELTFSRLFKVCDANECKYDVVDRMLRVSATIEDLARTLVFPPFKTAVELSSYTWSGRALPEVPD